MKKAISKTKKTTLAKSTKNTIGYINDLAHEGGKKAIEQLEKIVATEQDLGIKEHAKLALEECQFFYYSPETPQEEKEFILLKLISKKEDELFSEEIALDEILFQEQERDILNEITKKVVQNTKNKKQKKDFEEYLLDSSDALKCESVEKEEIEKNIAFLEAWIQEAYKHITIEKYKNIPPEVLLRIHGEYEDYENEECCGEDCEDECCLDDDCDCIKF